MVTIEIDGGKHQSLEEARKGVRKHQLKYRVFWDSENQNHRAYEVTDWPVGYLIGRDGKVIWSGNPLRVVGPSDRAAAFKVILEGALEHSSVDRLTMP